MDNKQILNQPLTLKQAASLAGLKYSTFYSYVNGGRGPESIMLDERRFFNSEAIKSWIKPTPAKRGPKPKIKVETNA